MATLTETAYYARRIINWSVVGLIGLILFRILFYVAVDAIRKAFPAPPLVPNFALGKLPKINFPQTASPSAQIQFTLQTISGTVPEASEAARVYFMPKNRSSFSSVTNAQTFVGRIGFTDVPRQINTTGYRWIDTKNPLRSIEVDTVSNHFTLKYAYIHDLSLFAEKQIPLPENAKREAENFLQNLGLAIPDMNFPNPKIVYLKLVGDQLEPTTSQSQADAVRLDYFRKSYDGMPVVTNKRNEGIITFIISGSRRSDRRLLLVNFSYWPLDVRTNGIYKLKKSSDAYTELQSGNAFFVSQPQNQTQFTITNIYLAYFDSPEAQLFLQPVFVFEGDPNFVAYISAVAPPWIEE